jgi:hypothetical protein
VPIGRQNAVPPPPPTPGPKPDPTPQEQEKLIKRGTLMAILYAEVGSYAKVAEMFDVATSTVRWWVHETRKRSKDELQKIADRLRGDIAQLAVDRVQEGLVEGDTEFAALLGAKVLHGLGELKTHSAIKNDLPPGAMNLTMVFTDKDPAQPAGDVVEGAVLGVARSLDAPQTSAADAE